MISKELELELKREVYKESYFEFFKFCFKILFPSEEYVDTFHIKYLCDILQKEQERIERREEKTKDIIINIPPRSSKSLITSVCLQAWVWIRMPSATFITVSFDADLSMMNSQLCKDIIKSDEYQELFGHLYEIRGDADAKTYFANNKGGFRLSKTVGGNITGHKAIWILCLPEGQKIMTEVGELDIKDIVDKKLDIRVLSHNLDTYTNEFKKITSYQKNKGTKLIKIKTKSKEFVCTEDHLVWTENRGYIQAKELTKEDELLCL